MQMSLEYLKRQALDTVGRYSFLTPKDIEKAFGVRPETLKKDRQRGLIEPISSKARVPEYDIAEIDAYFLRKGKTVGQ